MKKRNDYLDPPKILVLGFATVILIGTLLLTLPISTEDGKGLSFLNALFTATSATCVTGLVVVDTGDSFSGGLCFSYYKFSSHPYSIPLIEPVSLTDLAQKK